MNPKIRAGKCQFPLKHMGYLGQGRSHKYSLGSISKKKGSRSWVTNLCAFMLMPVCSGDGQVDGQAQVIKVWLKSRFFGHSDMSFILCIFKLAS